MKSPLLYILAPALLVLLIGAPASACECRQIPKLNQAFEEASLVFVGRVDEIKDSRFREGKKEIKFTVIKKFKGFEEVKTEKVLIYTPQEKQACGYVFLDNTDYLVYATGSPAYFKTDRCTRNSYIEGAPEDIRELEKLK